MKYRSDRNSINRITKSYNTRYYNSQTKNAIYSIEKEKDKKPISEDTLIRREIHEIIINRVNEGKSKVEILAELMNKYSDFPGAKFFGTQIDDRIKKEQKKKLNKGVQLDGEERD